MRRAIILAVFLAIPASIQAQTRWYEYPDQGFKVNVPTSYQTAEMQDGTDEIRAFLSADENLGLRVRTVPMTGVPLDQVIGFFEQNVLPQSQRLVLQDYELNGIDGKMAGYRWNYGGTAVIVAAFYTMRPDRFHAVWYLVPEDQFQARTAEGDAILNSFTLVEAQAEAPQAGGLGSLFGNPSAPAAAPANPTANPPASGGLTSIGGRTTAPANPPQAPPASGGLAAIGGRTNAPASPPPAAPAGGIASIGGQPAAPANPPQQPATGGAVASPQPSSTPAPAGYLTMVEETAGVEFPIPENFRLVDSSQGQSRYEGLAGSDDEGVQLVIQTVDRSSYPTMDAVLQGLRDQVAGNADAEEAWHEWPISDTGLEMLSYWFDLHQNGGMRFCYTVVPTRDHITYVSFVAPHAIMFRAEMHAEKVHRLVRVVGGGEDGFEPQAR